MNQPTKAEQEAKARREQQAASELRDRKAADSARDADRHKTEETHPQSGRGGTPGGPAPMTEQQRQAAAAHAANPHSADSNANEQARQGAIGTDGRPMAPVLPVATADPMVVATGIQRTEGQIAAAKAAYEASQEASVKMADAHRENEEAARAADTEKNERDHEIAKGVVEGAIAQGQSITSGQVPQQNPVVQAALAKLNQPAGGPMRADDVFPDSETVQMLVPIKGVTLTLDNGQKVYFPGGLQNVPKELAEHWYMKAHGVKEHKGPAPRPKAGVAGGVQTRG